MSKLDHLYSARWALSQAIEKNDFSKLDYAASEIAQAKGDIIEPPQEPDRPSASDPSSDLKPEIVYLGGVRVKTHGHYRTQTGEPQGLTVHHTAGHAVNDTSAILTLKDLAKRGLGCYVMAPSGLIFAPENFEDDPNLVAYHAGESEYAGKTSLSYYMAGMEICGAGLLNGNKTWWGKVIPDEQIRTVKARDNMVAGNYQKFTPEQEKTLLKFCLWQLKVNSQFSIDWVRGHYEISPGRKNDPSGSLSMSMAEFRQLLITEAIKLNLIKS